MSTGSNLLRLLVSSGIVTSGFWFFVWMTPGGDPDFRGGSILILTFPCLCFAWVMGGLSLRWIWRSVGPAQKRKRILIRTLLVLVGLYLFTPLLAFVFTVALFLCVAITG